MDLSYSTLIGFIMFFLFIFLGLMLIKKLGGDIMVLLIIIWVSYSILSVLFTGIVHFSNNIKVTSFTPAENIYFKKDFAQVDFYSDLEKDFVVENFDIADIKIADSNMIEEGYRKFWIFYDSSKIVYRLCVTEEIYQQISDYAQGIYIDLSPDLSK